MRAFAAALRTGGEDRLARVRKGKPFKSTGGTIDKRDEVTGRAALLQPEERRTILHYQLSKPSPPLAPHMHSLYTFRPWPPQSALGHPLSQGLAAHHQALLR